MVTILNANFHNELNFRQFIDALKFNNHPNISLLDSCYNFNFLFKLHD